jgi:hypothetical protein
MPSEDRKAEDNSSGELNQFLQSSGLRTGTAQSKRKLAKMLAFDSVCFIQLKQYVCSLCQYQGFFFSTKISEISPKTGFIGDRRYFQIPNETFRYS